MGVILVKKQRSRGDAECVGICSIGSHCNPGGVGLRTLINRTSVSVKPSDVATLIFSSTRSSRSSAVSTKMLDDLYCLLSAWLL